MKGYISLFLLAVVGLYLLATPNTSSATLAVVSIWRAAHVRDRVYLLASGIDDNQLQNITFNSADLVLGFNHGEVFHLDKVRLLENGQRILMTRFDIEAEGDAPGEGAYHGWDELNDNSKAVRKIIFIDGTPGMWLKMAARFVHSECIYSSELVKLYPPSRGPSTGFVGLMYAQKYLPDFQPCLVGFTGDGWHDAHDFGFEQNFFRQCNTCRI
jgi:hypothetical protein